MLPEREIYGPEPQSGIIHLAIMLSDFRKYIRSAVKFASSPEDVRMKGSGLIEFDEDLTEDFHIYSFEWTKCLMAFYLDDRKYWQLQLDQTFGTDGGDEAHTKLGAPFDHPFKLLINNDVFPRAANRSIKKVSNRTKSDLQIDWIRIYQRPKIPDRSKEKKQVTARVPETSATEKNGLKEIHHHFPSFPFHASR